MTEYCIVLIIGMVSPIMKYTNGNITKENSCSERLCSVPQSKQKIKASKQIEGKSPLAGQLEPFSLTANVFIGFSLFSHEKLLILARSPWPPFTLSQQWADNNMEALLWKLILSKYSVLLSWSKGHVQKNMFRTSSINWNRGIFLFSLTWHKE